MTRAFAAVPRRRGECGGRPAAESCPAPGEQWGAAAHERTGILTRMDQRTCHPVPRLQRHQRFLTAARVRDIDLSARVTVALMVPRTNGPHPLLRGCCARGYALAGW